MRYYRDERIKESSGWMSPMQYRKSLGLAAYKRLQSLGRIPDERFLPPILARSARLFLTRCMA